MKFCTNCGTQVTPEQKFCTKCGSPQKPATPPPAPVVEAPVIEAPVVVPEPQPVIETPAPAPAPAATPEYISTLQIVHTLSKAGVVDDVLDEPATLAPAAQNAWAQGQLAAITHKWGGAEFTIVFADGNLDASSYSALASHTVGSTSMRYGSWMVWVLPSSGQANESAAVLEKVFTLLG